MVKCIYTIHWAVGYMGLFHKSLWYEDPRHLPTMISWFMSHRVFCCYCCPIVDFYLWMIIWMHGSILWELHPSSSDSHLGLVFVSRFCPWKFTVWTPQAGLLQMIFLFKCSRMWTRWRQNTWRWGSISLTSRWAKRVCVATHPTRGSVKSWKQAWKK